MDVEHVPPASGDGNTLNTQLDGAARNGYDNLVAYLLAQESLCNRCLDGNLTSTQVSLVLTDNGVGHLGLCRQIGHLHLRQNLYGIS